ncbi:MAG: outer membrane protein transport protein [Bacteroidia bacterium]|nr:outer membrane protein transport protein [Bacteroidia bacterium]
MRLLTTLLFTGVWLLTKGYCGGFQLNLHGQRQLGMAHTGTGLALDGSSVFFNPGALGFQPRGSVMIGSSAVFPVTSFLARTPSVYQVNMDTLLFTPIYLYLSWSGKAETVKKKGLSYGISVNNPYLGGSKWPDDWKGKFISQEFAINTFFIQPTLSYKFNDKVGIGLGFSYGFASLFNRKAIKGDGPNGSEGAAILSGTGRGAGINAGLFLKPNEQVSLGVSWRSPVRIHIPQGAAKFDVPESLEDVFPDMSFSTAFTLPGVLSIGLGYRPDERWLLAADLNFTGWSRYDSLHFTFEQEIPPVSKWPSRKGFINSTTFRIGGEYQINPRIRFRGGVYYDQSPVPEGFVSPELPDADRIGLSIGTGINLAERLFFDLSWLYEFTGERTAIFDEAVFGGTYKTSTNIAGIGIRYDF